MTRASQLLIAAFCSAWWTMASADEVDEIYRLADQHKSEAAMERLDTFLKTHPKDARGRFLKGLLYTDQKRRDEAIGVFRGLAEDYPELPEPLNNLAVLFAEQGSYEEARNALLMAIKTHPSYATAHENLGDIYAKMASQAYSKALQLNQNSSATQAKLALVKKLFVPPAMESSERPIVVANASRPAVVTTKPEPAKMDPLPEPAKVAAKLEEPKPEPVKPEPVKPEPVKPEPVKPEPVKVDVVKPEPAPQVKRELVKTVEPAPPPVAKSSHQAREEVVQILTNWASAWSGKDVDKYIGYYSSQFKPGDGMDRKAWEKLRGQRLRAPRFIQVRVSDIQVEINEQGLARASFKQVYQSSSINSTGKKNLLLKKEAGTWRILQELYDG